MEIQTNVSLFIRLNEQHRYMTKFVCWIMEQEQVSTEGGTFHANVEVFIIIPLICIIE